MGKSKLLTRTFVIFTALLLLTFSIIIFVYDYSMNKYAEDEISRSSTGKLKIIRSINELVVDFVGKDALKLSLNAKVNDLYNSIKESTGEERIESILLMKDMFHTLEQIVSISSTIHSVYLYLEDADYIVSSNYGASYTKDFYDTLWFAEYSKVHGQAVWLTSRKPMNADANSNDTEANAPTRPEQYVVTYMFPLSAYTTAAKGAILINLYEDELSKLINRNTEEDGLIFIVNRDGDVISHPDKQLVGQSLAGQSAMEKVTASPLTEGYFVEEEKGERQLISYYKSNVNDWTYIAVNSLDRLTLKAHNLRLKLTYAFLLLLLIEILGSYLILKKLYSPVRRLIQTLKYQRKLNVNDNDNEVAVLTHAFHDIIKQEEQLFSALEKNKNTLRNEAVKRMLHGEALESLDSDLIDIDFPHRSFICGVVSFDKYKAFQAAFPENHQYYLSSVLLKLSVEMMREPWKSVGAIADKNQLALIVNCEFPDTETCEIWLKGVIEFIQHEIRKLTDFSVSAGFGRLYDGPEGIEASYEEAVLSMQRRLISGKESIIFYEDRPSALPKAYYPSARESAQFNQLQLGSLAGVERGIAEFFEDIRGKKELSVDHIYLILNQFTAVTIKHAMEWQMNPSDLNGNTDQNIYKQLLELETLDEMMQLFVVVYRNIFEQQHADKSGGAGYLDRAMAYIRQNYRSDIDLNELSDKVGVSYSQLRRRFQSETGENMLAYINKLRIEEAKRLLSQTSISISDIAISLGYNNEQSLNRFFKKFEGITPGDYRKIGSHHILS